MTKLLTFAPILLATRSICVSENYKKWKNSFAEFFFSTKLFFGLISSKPYAKRYKLGGGASTFRLILIQKYVRLVLNQLENGKYYLISV